MLIGWIAAVIGIIIVVFSLNQLIREIRKAGIPNMEDQSFSDTFYNLLSRVEKLGEDLDDINQTFYESTERIEKRVETLEKKTPPMEPIKQWPKESYIEPSVKKAPTVNYPATEPSEEIRMATEIRKLLNEGKDSQQVARELNLGVGEVELIRRLRPEQKRGV